MKKAYFAAGCFWGVQYYFEQAKGVTATQVGFMGGHIDAPTYLEVVHHNTGHLEAIEVTYDESKISYTDLAKLFFEIHDFTQTNGQGPDIGEQYLSAIFYGNTEEKEIAEHLIQILTEKGYIPATTIRETSTFWPAEEYHQHYYQKNGKEPYCHVKRTIF